MIESKDFEELFASLKDHDVRYLVVGGYAVAVHARPRFTDDLDLFIPTQPDDGDRRYSGTYGSQPVHFVSRDDLIASKQAAGRPMDHEDLRLLRLGAG